MAIQRLDDFLGTTLNSGNTQNPPIKPGGLVARIDDPTLDSSTGRVEGISTSKSDKPGAFENLINSLIRGNLNVASAGAKTAGNQMAKDIGLGSTLGPMVPGNLPQMWGFGAGMADKLFGTDNIRTAQEGVIKRADEIASPIEEAKSRFPRNTDDAWNLMGTIVGEAIPYMGAALVASQGGAGKMGAAVVGYAVAGQDAYDSAKESGASEGEAEMERAVIGSINAAIEALQIGSIMKFKETGKHTVKEFIKLARNKMFKSMYKTGRGFTADLLKEGIEEGLEEFAQAGVSMLVPAVYRGVYPQKEDGSPDWWSIGQELGFNFLAGGIAGAALSGGMSATGISGGMDLSIDEVRDMTGSIVESKLDLVQQGAMLQNLAKMAEEAGIDPVEAGITLKIADEAKPILDAARRVQEDLTKFAPEARRKQKKRMKETRGKRFAEYDTKVGELMSKGVSAQAADRLGKAALKGTLVEDFTPLKERFSPDQVDALHRAVALSNLEAGNRRHLHDALNDMFVNGKLPQPAAVRMFDDLFGTNITNIINKATNTTWRKIVSTLNTPRALMASMDFSAGGRQGILLLPNNPIIWSKANAKGYRAMANSNYANLVDMQIRTDPTFQLYQKYGGYLTRITDAQSHEEPFTSELAEKLAFVRGSERAYTTTLNSLRFYTFKKIVEGWQGSGATGADYKKLASFINHATGRGDLPKWLDKYSNELNAVFFAPKLQMGRIQAITDILPTLDEIAAVKDMKPGDLKRYSKGIVSSKDPEVNKSMLHRKVIARDLVAGVLTGLGVLALLAMVGAEVEVDPRSSDFGKAKFGNTRLDFWGGYSQIARFVAQMITGERKSLSGNIIDLDQKEVLYNFLRSKLSPTAGMTVDVWQGETMLGDKVSTDPDFLGPYALQHLTPLFAQDVYDAIAYQGVGSMMMAFPLALHGVGAQTYEPSAHQNEMDVKNHYSQQTFGVGWDDLGGYAQQMLKVNNPQIMHMEEKSKSEREDFDFVGKILEMQVKAGRKVQAGLNTDIKRELAKYEVGVGGMSQTLGQGWRLNSKKYKQYQDKTQDVLNKVLKVVIRSNIYRNLTPTGKREFLQEMIDYSKKQVRAGITAEANMADIERMRNAGRIG